MKRELLLILFAYKQITLTDKLLLDISHNVIN